MGKSGRNIKRRLYSLTLIGNRLSRVKHFRGHGVHSPFVYGLVRKAFMNHKSAPAQSLLYDALIRVQVSKKRALELQKAAIYCNAESFAIDCTECSADFNILTATYPASKFNAALDSAKSNKTTLIIMQPYMDRVRTNTLKELILCHRSTVVDNRGYIIFFNNHLPKQYYRL